MITGSDGGFGSKVRWKCGVSELDLETGYECAAGIVNAEQDEGP